MDANRKYLLIYGPHPGLAKIWFQNLDVKLDIGLMYKVVLHVLPL